MLVYLDSDHLAKLERAPRATKDYFLAAWHDKHCEIALTLHHLQEISQLATRESVLSRLDLLADFPIIRCLPASEALVVQFEIQLQVHELLGRSVDVRRSALDTLFPLATLERIRNEVLASESAFRKMRRAYELTADASNTAKRAQQSGRLALRRAVDPAALTGDGLRDLVEDAVADLPDETKHIVRAMFEQVRAAILEGGNPRRGLETLFGLSDVAVLGQIPDSDLAPAASYFAQARDEVRNMVVPLGLKPADAEGLVRQLSPYLAPGFALRMAVLRARRPHPRKDEPGDDIDAAHVTFAPYVDLLFVDRRTFAFTAQELRDRPSLLPRSDRCSVASATDIEELADTIAAHRLSA